MFFRVGKFHIEIFSDCLFSIWSESFWAVGYNAEIRVLPFYRCFFLQNELFGADCRRFGFGFFLISAFIDVPVRESNWSRTRVVTETYSTFDAVNNVENSVAFPTRLDVNIKTQQEVQRGADPSTAQSVTSAMEEFSK
jgi:hypothetical protein